MDRFIGSAGEIRLENEFSRKFSSSSCCDNFASWSESNAAEGVLHPFRVRPARRRSFWLGRPQPSLSPGIQCGLTEDPFEAGRASSRGAGRWLFVTDT